MTFLQKEVLKEVAAFAVFLLTCFAILIIFDDADVLKLTQNKESMTSSSSR